MIVGLTGGIASSRAPWRGCSPLGVPVIDLDLIARAGGARRALPTGAEHFGLAAPDGSRTVPRRRCSPTREHDLGLSPPVIRRLRRHRPGSLNHRQPLLVETAGESATACCWSTAPGAAAPRVTA
jgi:hypothetical protein